MKPGCWLCWSKQGHGAMTTLAAIPKRVQDAEYPDFGRARIATVAGKFHSYSNWRACWVYWPGSVSRGLSEVMRLRAAKPKKAM